MRKKKLAKAGRRFKKVRTKRLPRPPGGRIVKMDGSGWRRAKDGGQVLVADTFVIGGWPSSWWIQTPSGPFRGTRR